MSASRFVLGLMVGLSCSASLARAILIETNDGKKTTKVAGFFVKDDGKNLTIRIHTPDGPEVTYSRAKIKIEVLHQLDVKRLERLSRGNPKAYREYAEELARQKEDPEAQDTAMRLYLIAAYLAWDKFGSSSLLAASELAGPAEYRKCRALAFLLDPEAGAELLKAQDAKPAPLDKTQAGALEDFVKALQLYRAGKISEASATAKKPGVDKIFEKTPFKTDQMAFLRWCDDAHCVSCKKGTLPCPTCNGLSKQRAVICPTCSGKGTVKCRDCDGTHVRDPLPPQDLAAVLRCELWALGQLGGGEAAGRKEATEAKGWSAVLQSGRLDPVSRLSLETAFPDLDPRKCCYRNGKWVEK
jgi:hypothetical protein